MPVRTKLKHSIDRIQSRHNQKDVATLLMVWAPIRAMRYHHHLGPIRNEVGTLSFMS